MQTNGPCVTMPRVMRRQYSTVSLWAIAVLLTQDVAAPAVDAALTVGQSHGLAVRVLSTADHGKQEALVLGRQSSGAALGLRACFADSSFSNVRVEGCFQMG